MRAVRGLVFHLPEPLPPAVRWLLGEFRLMVNEFIRAGLKQNVTSRNGLNRVAYKAVREGHNTYAKYVPCAAAVAGGILKNYRHAVRKGKEPRTPYAKRLMLKLENQGYTLDLDKGILHLPIRAGEHVAIALPLSTYHLGLLAAPGVSLGDVTITPTCVIIALRKEAPEPYEPRAILALDTNEDSVDGVLQVGASPPIVAQRSFEGVRQIQETHFRRRRRLDQKKAHDRRTKRRLLHKEGTRERARVQARLHRVANAVLAAAERHRAAIVLEDLTLHGASGPSRRMNRRLNAWPRRQLHAFISYKALWRGIPTLFVNPAYSSKTCPICGSIAQSRTRAGAVFACPTCPWRCNRQINAGLNLLHTARASDETLARAVRFQPAALRYDTMNPLYAPPGAPGGARGEPNAGSSVILLAHGAHASEPPAS